MEEVRKEEYLRVFYHELGHWTIAKWVGFRPRNITISSKYLSNWMSEGSCITVLYTKCSTVQDVSKYLIARQLVLLAGATFESRCRVLSINEALSLLCRGTSNDDYKKFMELATLSLNLMLGEQGRSISSLAEELNKEEDKFHSAIIELRKQLLDFICHALHGSVFSGFINNAVDLFMQRLKECGNSGEVTVFEQELNCIYDSENIEICDLNSIVPFDRTILRKLVHSSSQ
ncbi:hypothetical protein [Brenneria corticis]|nr:hypothetical protein [Brenneria sp. CFCC 11842]